jgi:nicotinamide-nucleotide amidase
LTATPAPDQLEDVARSLLQAADREGVRIAVAESCTGGLLAALLTDVEGLSHIFDRGFVTYSEVAKTDVLGLDPEHLKTEGAVSEWVAREMAKGALERSKASLAVAITGYAGPGEGEEGLVHTATARRRRHTIDILHHEAHYGSVGRAEIRARAAREALSLMRDALA